MPPQALPSQMIPLDGEWNFSLDPADAGVEEKWYSRKFDGTILVPSSWAEAGYGDPPASRFIDGWNQRFEYEGAAWYSRLIDAPVDWAGKAVELVLKGVRWSSQVWLDGQYAGEGDSLSTAQRFDLTALTNPGTRQRLTVRVDNRMIYPLRENHVNSQQTATHWGGITGGVELIARDPIHFAQINVRPNVAAKRFEFAFELSASGAELVSVTVTDPQSGARFSGAADVSGNHADIVVEMGDAARLWWDDDPFLYDAEFTLSAGGAVADVAARKIGLREFTARGKDFLLNGRPVFLRGYVDCCIFPLTGYPSWDVEEYRRQFRIAKTWGFNHVRLHSWTAPEPFWQAADEAGMLVQAELPNWSAYYGHRETEPPEGVHDYLRRELERIVRALSAHPSWVLFSNGNELIYGGDGHPRLLELAALGKSLDPTRLFTDNTGFGQLPAPHRSVDFYIQSCNWHPPKKIYDAASNDTTQDFSAITAFADRPLIGHEHGQFTMYVRPAEAAKYTGSIQPTFLESVIETFAVKGIEGRVDDFVRASGTHIARTYKENIERARRTRGLSGLHLLDIRDFPGQGHATTGLLDMFWDDKGMIEPETFAQFNSAVVLLMRAPSPTFWNGGTLSVDLEVSNFGHELISGQPLAWELRGRGGGESLRGEMAVPPAPAGAITALGRLEIAVPPSADAHAWELIVRLGDARNSWHVWTFPYPQARQDDAQIVSRIPGLRGVLPQAGFGDDFFASSMQIADSTRLLTPQRRLAISERLTARLLQYLHDGGSVWLMPGAKELYDAVRTRYLPPFWSYLLFPDNVSSVMGTIIHPHPALERFPHDGISDWLWYTLVNETPAICLDSIPAIQPIVEVVDNFNRAKRLAYAFEARVGAGRLFVSTWRLTDPGAAGRPETRWLLTCVLDYLLGDQFAPEARLSVGELLGLFKLTTGIIVDSD